MSVLNVAFHDDAVWFLTDTMVYSGDGRPSGLCDRKAHVGRSGRFIFCTRGAVLIGDAVADLLASAETLAEAVARTRHFLSALPSYALEGYDRAPIEVTLAGWSGAAADLVVIQFSVLATLDGAYSVRERAFDRGVTLLPGSPSAAQLPRTVTEGQFVRLALAQWKIQDRLPERQCLGGVMHLTTVDRSGAEQRIAAVYPDYAQHAAELGDPNAEAVARFLAEREAVAA